MKEFALLTLNFKKHFRFKSIESVFYIADQAFYNLFSFVLIVILARTLPAAPFGHFTYAYYLFPFLSIIQHAVVQMPLMNQSGKYGNETDSYFIANLVLSFSLGIGVSIIFASILLLIKISLVDSILFSLFYFLFQFFEILRRILIVQKKKIRLLFADIIRFVIPVFLLFSLNQSTNILLILILGFLFLNIVIFPYNILSSYRSSLTLFFWTENWRFGRWIILNNIAQNLSSNLFLYLGVVLLTTDELVQLNAPRVVLGLGSILFLSMENVYTPKLHLKEGQLDKLQRQVGWIVKDFQFFLILFYSLLLFVLFVQGMLAQYLFKIPSKDSIMWAYVCVLALSGLYRPILIVLRHSGLDRELYKASVFSLIAVLIFTYPVMSHFGLLGAIVMMLLLPLYNLFVGLSIMKKFDDKSFT